MTRVKKWPEPTLLLRDTRVDRSVTLGVPQRIEHMSGGLSIDVVGLRGGMIAG